MGRKVNYQKSTPPHLFVKAIIIMAVNATNQEIRSISDVFSLSIILILD